MAKHLIVMGHGEKDPGAVALGRNERDWNRNILLPALKKQATKLKNNTVEFYDTNKDMFQESQRGRGAYTVSNSYKSVTEYHEDAAGATATGGHVIISTKFNPDAQDLAIANVVKKYTGLWAGIANSKGINKRNNLLNLNVFADRGISYRLVELGFLTNAKDMKILEENIDSLAKDMIEAITGEELTVSESESPKPSTGFDINNYHTKKYAQIKLVKADYAYKEKELKTKVGKINPKGSVFTVVDIVYAGKYPRYKLKSGLYVTTRKDTVEEFKKGTAAAKPKPTTNLKGSNLPSSGRYTVTTATNIRSKPSTSASIEGTYSKGGSFNYDSKITAEGYVWLSYISYSNKRRYVAVV